MTELEYGINVANKFDLLFGDDDPSEALTKAQAPGEKKKKVEPAKAPAGNVLKEKAAKGAVPAGKAPAPGAKPEQGKTGPKSGAPPQAGDKKPQQGGQQQRPPRSAPLGGRPEQGKENTSRPPRTEGGQQRSPAAGGPARRPFGGPRPEGGAPRNDFSAPAPTGGDQEVPEARAGFGGRGGYRGGSSGFRGRASPRHQYPREPRPEGQESGAPSHARGREYERHSGSNKTGVKPVAKREGGGAHNWGSFKEDAEMGEAAAQGAPVVEGTPVKEGEEGAHPEAAPAEAVPEVPEEPQERQLTLQEYLQQEEANRLRPKYQVRQANEGESEQKVFQKMKRIQKEKASADGMVEVVEYVEVDVDDESHVPGSKQAKGGPFQLVFAPAARVSGERGERGERSERGFRGGRGGPRGGRGGPAQHGGRGGPRGGHGGRQAPPPQDELNFPALG